MIKFRDRVGEVIGRLTITSRANDAYKNKIQWNCICECGNMVIVRGDSLKINHTRSCGCLLRQKTAERKYIHGHSGDSLKRTSEYRSWMSMFQRTQNPNNPNWMRYGGRGIELDKRWFDFSNFLADMGEKPSSSYSIERRDNDGNYSKENCYWATRIEQMRNTSKTTFVEFDGIKQPLSALTAKYKVPLGRTRYRINMGWTVERALFEAPKSSAKCGWSVTND